MNLVTSAIPENVRSEVSDGGLNKVVVALCNELIKIGVLTVPEKNIAKEEDFAVRIPIIITCQ